MNKLKVNENKEYIINEDTEVIIENNLQSFKLTIKSNSKVLVNRLSYNDNIEIMINIEGNNNELKYIHSNINKKDSKIKLIVNNYGNNNHGKVIVKALNYGNQILKVGTFSKEALTSNFIEECSIINLDQGIGEIEPFFEAFGKMIEVEHSAYIGTFKDEVLFYLATRGINQEQAIKLLSRAFILKDLPKDFEKQLRGNYE